MDVVLCHEWQIEIDPSGNWTMYEHPEPNGWSVGQVLEHLCVADELYDAPLAALLRSARKDAGAPARERKPSFIGRLIAGSLLKPKPLKAPKVFRPGPTPRNGVVEELLAREMKFVKAMDDAASYDWRVLRIGSPALPSWAPKMNLGDGFRICCATGSSIRRPWLNEPAPVVERERARERSPLRRSRIRNVLVNSNIC